MTSPARGQAVLQGRWGLGIRGPDIGEVGDLRFDKSTARILMLHNDSAFQVLENLRISGGHISFSLARSRLRFEGVVTDSVLSGTVRDNAGNQSTWDAFRFSPERDYWPVPPRVIVRQLAMGSIATAERIPLAWLAGAPDSTVLEREYRDLASAAGMPMMPGIDRDERAGLVSLGLDESGRAAARATLNRIIQMSGDDPVPRSLFMRDGRWKLDIHDAMLWEAPHYLNGFSLSHVADGLRSLRDLASGANDSAAIRQSAWRLWSQMATADSSRVRASIDTLASRDGMSANALRAMLAGFDDARAWWHRAVAWLLTQPWLDTPQGRRSPAQLMAAFWGVDSLPLPEIRDEHFGGYAAMPMVSVQRVGPWLFAPGNAIAGEWLAHDGIKDAFAFWRVLRWGESPPLTVTIGGRTATVASPGSQALVHPASFFGDRDGVRIDPGIMPLAAVAAVLHEWNHLLAAQHRLAGPHPVALVQSADQLQVREDDPWLAEGFAEWATDEVLRPAGASASFLRFTQAEKRLGIAATDPSDPHVLGYRLVRGALGAHRIAAFRDLVVQNLHDPVAFARAAGLAAGTLARSITLQRPATAVIIPEVTFTWNEGSVMDWSRRLVIPNTRSEH